MSRELAEVIEENGIFYYLGEHDLYYPDLRYPEGTDYNVGITEGLKAKEQMKWVGLMNNVKSAVEEIVLREVILNVYRGSCSVF